MAQPHLLTLSSCKCTAAFTVAFLAPVLFCMSLPSNFGKSMVVTAATQIRCLDCWYSALEDTVSLSCSCPTLDTYLVTQGNETFRGFSFANLGSRLNAESLDTRNNAQMCYHFFNYALEMTQAKSMLWWYSHPMSLNPPTRKTFSRPVAMAWWLGMLMA